MNNITTNAFRAVTIGAMMTLGFGAADASAAGLASGQSVSDGVKQYVVRFPDLDLSKIDGATALYTRISHAARIVCRPLDSRDLEVAAKYRTCQDLAVAKAVASVNRPLLSQYHDLRTKGDKAALIQLARANY